MAWMPSYNYITGQDQLNTALSVLKTRERCAVDTESSGFYTYDPELCLIQISSGDIHLVIDTLAELNLNALGDIFADPAVTKIFHSAPSDMLEMKRDFGWEFHNIFDSYLACRMMGMESCSLLNLVKLYCGVDLEKKEQKSNWKKRPLTQSQLNYAHLDTAYLEKIMDSMTESLKESGLMYEIQSELDFMEHELQTENYQRQIQEDAWMKIDGVKFLSSEKKGALKDLFLFRENKAKQLNIAPFRLLTNQTLYNIASNKPANLSELRKSAGYGNDFLRKESDAILEILKNAPPVEQIERRRNEEFDPQIEELFKRLKKWRTFVAEKRGMDASVILSNRVLKTIAKEKPSNQNDLKKLKLMSDWKLDHYTDQLISVLNQEEITDLPDGLIAVNKEK